MTKRQLNKINKQQKEMVGLSSLDVLKYIFEKLHINGAEENSSGITFVKNNFKWEIHISNDVCDSVKTIDLAFNNQ